MALVLSFQLHPLCGECYKISELASRELLDPPKDEDIDIKGTSTLLLSFEEVLGVQRFAICTVRLAIEDHLAHD